MDGDSKATDAAPAPSGVGTPDKRRRRGRRWLVEWAVVVLVAVAVALVVRTFVFETYYIPSGSMEPTLMVGDRILVDKLGFHLTGLHRGDIVVFRRPPLEPDPVPDLVKRIIGLPGETIATSPSGQVLIDGKPLAEPWLPRGTTTFPIPGDYRPWSLRHPYTIPKGEYYVMGDNRGNSSDSRVFGPIPASSIVGRAVFRIWPLSRLGGL